MKILVLGATGMLGHKLIQILSRKFDVTGTVRGRPLEYSNHPVLGKTFLLGNVRAESFDSVVGAVASVRPDVVINCIGIIKQQPFAKSPLPSIAINALFPHQLTGLCKAAGARLIHLSTDCVFSGLKGSYKEVDMPDPVDLYGRTKLLGEVVDPGCITLRTSIVGRELQSSYGLIEWFFSHKGGSVHGYTRAIYTGFTTSAMADLICYILEQHPNLAGLWHASSEPISKYELLEIVNKEFQLGVTIEKDETFVCDRSLDSTRLRKMTGLKPPSWKEMIAEMAVDPTPYGTLK
jgi:dTDP-4-dehydrorhamnose reductase